MSTISIISRTTLLTILSASVLASVLRHKGNHTTADLLVSISALLLNIHMTMTIMFIHGEQLAYWSLFGITLALTILSTIGTITSIILQTNSRK
jgi:multisubunit Na+/H+ antiporter MnhF subunit